MGDPTISMGCSKYFQCFLSFLASNIPLLWSQYCRQFTLWQTPCSDQIWPRIHAGVTVITGITIRHTLRYSKRFSPISVIKKWGYEIPLNKFFNRLEKIYLEESFRNMYNTVGLPMEKVSWKKVWSNKITFLFGNFICQNFLWTRCDFGSVCHGLGSSTYGYCCFLWPGYGIKLQNEPWRISESNVHRLANCSSKLIADFYNMQNPIQSQKSLL